MKAQYLVISIVATFVFLGCASRTLDRVHKSFRSRPPRMAIPRRGQTFISRNCFAGQRGANLRFASEFDIFQVERTAPGARDSGIVEKY